MAMVEVPTPDLEQTTLRPIVMDMVKQLIEITGIDPGTRIIYPGTIGVAQQNDSNLTPSENKNFFGFGDQLFVEVMEDFVDARIMSTAVFRGENAPIFLDEPLNVWVRPSFATSRVTLNFRQRFKDKVSAFKWRDELKNRVSAGRQAMVHKVTYSYMIPDAIHVLLKEIHKLRENQAGYGQTYDEWFKRCITSNATVGVTMDGRMPEVLIPETQSRVQGYFDFEGRPDVGEADDTGPCWYMNFQYTFEYDKPTGMVAGYPIVVHNQMLHKDFRRSNPTLQETMYRMAMPWSLANLYEFETERWPEVIAQMNGLTIPPYDDYVPSEEVEIPGTNRVFTCLLKITKENTAYLVNLKELGKRNLCTLMQEFMASEFRYLTMPYKSVLNLSLYRQQYRLSHKDNPITVDQDLNVIANNPLDLRKTYHLHLSLFKDWGLITRDAKDRLRSNACVVKMLAHAINPYLDLSFIKPVGGPCGLVPWAQMNELEDKLNKAVKIDPGNNIQFNTVELFFVDTGVNHRS